MARTPSLPLHQDIFTYGPALSEHEIRLLSVEPGRSKICCSLTTHRLDTQPVYEALSYAWGDDRKAYPIICNGQRLYVTKSLFLALCQLRRNGQAARLWVDALCINQADNAEKSVQVRMMRAIYEGAQHVLVWLGLAEETDEAGLELLRRVHDRCGLTQPDDMSKDFSFPQQLGLPGINDPGWRSVFKMLHRPYFSRIWIVQEFLLARRCTVLLGPHNIDGDAVLAFAGATQKYPGLQDAMAINSSINATWVINSASLNAPAGAGVTPGPPHPEGSSSKINVPVACQPSFISLWFLKYTLFRFGGVLIVELLNNTRMFKAKDPRDRIFALVGLASHFDPDFAKRLVDYNKSFRDLQIELAMWLLGNQRRTESMVLSYAGDTGRQLDSLPSWVPDWSGGTSSVYACPLVATYYAYHDIASMLNPPVDRRFISGTKMEIWCTVLDCVVSTINHIPYMTSTTLLTDEQLLSQHSREMEAWDDACWDLVVNSGPSHIYAATGQHIFEAYWRTLIFDTDTENRGTIAPPELKSSYQHWASSFGTMNQLERLETEQPPGYGLAQATGLVSVGAVQAMRGRAFEVAFRTYAAGRKFCATGRGYIGWVPLAAREGDLVCYFEENTLPFVIRGCEDGYRLVGDCYLHGMMRGPGLDAVPRSRKIVLH